MHARTLVYPEYEYIRPRLKTGDIVAFSGGGFISRAVEFFAKYPSHVEMIAHTSSGRVQLIGSTSMKIGDTGRRVVGVQRTYLSDRLQNYNGSIYVLPLVCPLPVSEENFNELLHRYEDLGYDFWQAARRGWSAYFPDLIPLKESKKRVFCSELIAFILKDLKVIYADINASGVTPNDICRYPIYQEAYYQLTGAKKELPLT